MTNDIIYKWLLDNPPSADNIVQWEELANTLWFRSKTTPNLNLNMDSILEIANYYNIIIPNDKTEAVHEMNIMLNYDPVEFNFDNYLNRITNGRG